MRRTGIFWLLCVLLGLLLAGCAGASNQEQAAWKDCRGAGRLIAALPEAPSSADRERAETLLAEKGYGVLRNAENLPEYLENSDGMRRFLEEISAGADAAESVYQVTKEGNVFCLRFWQKKGSLYATYVTARPGERDWQVRETYQVRDWYLSDRGSFYYQTFYVDDQHYANYNRIRLQKPDADLYQWTRDCVLPVGYTGANLFLVDWSEGSAEELHLEDLWDCFVGWEQGFRPEPETLNFAYNPKGYFEIPAERFEQTLFPRFPFSKETFRRLGHYDSATDTYPWVPLESELAVRFSHPILEPEVTACVEQPDGTRVLTVEVASTDLKTDCLFSHRITVLPLEEGRCRYLGNQILIAPPEEYPLRLSRLEVSERAFW